MTKQCKDCKFYGYWDEVTGICTFNPPTVSDALINLAINGGEKHATSALIFASVQPTTQDCSTCGKWECKDE